MTITHPAERWEASIRAFEAEDRLHPPPSGGLVFVGSSSIHGWTELREDFAGLPVIQRGFGGSELRDSAFYAERIVVAYRPRAIVLYAGDNDIGNGLSAGEIFQEWLLFVAKIHAACPSADIFFVSLKPAPSRLQSFGPQLHALNDLAREHAAATPHVHYIDIFGPMLDENGVPKAEFFGADQLHMTRAGYKVWAAVIRPIVAPLFRVGDHA